MFWTPAFESMRQKTDQTSHSNPFRFTRCDVCVEHCLRTVCEIPKLSFPTHEC